MKRCIIGFHLDEDEHWVADLECGHTQHVRHDPPLIHRDWVLKEETRQKRIGMELDCIQCLPSTTTSPTEDPGSSGLHQTPD